MSVGSLCYMPEVLTCYTSTRYACAQSRPTLCNPTTEACQVPVRGIFQAWTLKQVAISYFRGSSWPRDQTCISCTSCIGSCLLYHCTTWEAPKCQLYLNTKKQKTYDGKTGKLHESFHVQLCSTLCKPTDCRPPGSSVQENSPGENTRVGGHSLLQGIFLILGSNPVSCRFFTVWATREAPKLYESHIKRDTSYHKHIKEPSYHS